MQRNKLKAEAGQTEAEQTKAGQTKAEEAKAEQTKAEQTKAEQTKGRKTKANQAKTKRKNTKDKGQGKSLHLEDLAMKTAALYFGEELLGYFGIEERIAGIAPTEAVLLEARQMYQDFLYVMEDGTWRHLEFESDGITLEDLKRFREYEAATSRAYHVAVLTTVVCSSTVKSPMSSFTECINTYHVETVRLKDGVAEEVFRRLSGRKKEEVGKKDLLPVLLTPLMSGRMGQKERVIQGFQYLEDPRVGLKSMEREKMQAVLYALAEKFLNEAELGDIKEVIAMTRLGQMLVEDGMKRGLERGMKQGIALTKKELVAKKLKKGKNPEEIAEALEESVDTIQDLINELKSE